MKSLWNKIISWFKPNIHKEESYELVVHRHTHEDLIELPQERLNEMANEDTKLVEKESQKESALDFIEQKKNRKPFYKADNKKDWE